jgi:hypothetical protein
MALDPSDIEDIKNAIKLGIQQGVSASGGAGGGAGTPTAPTGPDMSAQIGAAEQYLAQLQAMEQTDETRMQIAEQLLRIEQLKLKQAMQRSDLTAAELRDLQKAVKLREQELENLKASTAEQKKMLDMLKSYGKDLSAQFQVFNASPLFNASKIWEVGKALFSAKGGAIAFLKSLAGGIIESFINNTIGVLFAIDEARSAFQKATGATREYANVVMEAYDEQAIYTVGIEETTAAFQDLFVGASSFNQMSMETQKQVGKTVAMLEGFGIATSEAAAGFETLVRVMGQSGREAEGTLRELTAMALDFGVAPAQMISDFAQVSPQLAKLGRDGEKAFKNLARVSKITGMEIGKLLELVNKFDTFEGAADTAGQLNAALGGNFVNAMDLMTETDPVGRFEMIRGALDDAGLAFDDMDYYQRQFYANALTGGDVGQLALMMSGNLGELGDQVNMNSSDYEELAERQASMATLMEKFQSIIAALTPKLIPLLDKFHEWLDAVISQEGALEELEKEVMKFLQPLFDLKDLIKGLIDNWYWWVAGYAALKLAIWLTTSALSSQMLAQRAANMQQMIAARGHYKQLAQMKAAVPMTLALGAAILMMGLGFAAAAWGASKLATAMKGMGFFEWAGFAIICVALGAGIFFLAKMMLAATVPTTGFATAMIGLGFAIMLVGLGVAIAALGLMALVLAIGEAGAGPLAAFAFAMLGVAAAIYAINLSLIALANPAALLGMAAFKGLIIVMASALGILMVILGLIMRPLTQMLSKMTDLADLGMSDLGSGFQEIATAIGSISLIKLFALNKMLKSTKDALTAAKKAGYGLGMGQGGAEAPASNQGGAVTRRVNSVREHAQAATGQRITIPITLNVDGRQFADALIEVQGQEAVQVLRGRGP